MLHLTLRITRNNAQNPLHMGVQYSTVHNPGWGDYHVTFLFLNLKSLADYTLCQTECLPCQKRNGVVCAQGHRAGGGVPKAIVFMASQTGPTESISVQQAGHRDESWGAEQSLVSPHTPQLGWHPLDTPPASSTHL